MKPLTRLGVLGHLNPLRNRQAVYNATVAQADKFATQRYSDVCIDTSAAIASNRTTSKVTPMD
jgi:hypothetical protein